MDFVILMCIGSCIATLPQVEGAPRNLKKVNIPTQGQDDSINNGALKNINVTSRFPDLEDERVNWGVMNNDSTDENEEVYNRPITIMRYVPKPIPSRKIAKGTVLTPHERRELPPQQISPLLSPQSSQVLQTISKSLEKPTRSKSTVRCEEAVVACCTSKHQRQHCDTAEKCLRTSNVCDLPFVKRSIDQLIYFYNDSP